jgi:hypothetical protein
VVASLGELFRKREANSNTGDWEMELISADLSDACMHFGVHPDEIQNCLAPGLDDDELVLFKAMSFGFKGAPRVMGRFSSAAMRLCQSMMPEAQGQIQCYMDDPLLMLQAQGPPHERLALLAMVLYTANACGLQLSYAKAERGIRLSWIGVSIEVDEPNKVINLSPPEKLVEEVTIRLQT